MKYIVRGSLAAIAVAVLTLTGCASAGTGSYAEKSSDSSESAGPTASDAPGSTDKTDQPVLATADSTFGSIIVDGTGRSVYVFDKDTPGSGSSACEGDCLAKWPAVPATDDSPGVKGVTGTVATITRSDGSRQVTVNGSPVYLFAGDLAAGDVKGQGIGGIWWLVGPDGTKITKTPAG